MWLMLKANEVFNMHSDADYTGIYVSARKPVAVYGGCRCDQVPDNTAECDHIMEQVGTVLSAQHSLSVLSAVQRGDRHPVIIFSLSMK